MRATCLIEYLIWSVSQVLASMSDMVRCFGAIFALLVCVLNFNLVYFVAFVAKWAFWTTFRRRGVQFCVLFEIEFAVCTSLLILSFTGICATDVWHERGVGIHIRRWALREEARPALGQFLWPCRRHGRETLMATIAGANHACHHLPLFQVFLLNIVNDLDFLSALDAPLLVDVKKVLVLLLRREDVRWLDNSVPF